MTSLLLPLGHISNTRCILNDSLWNSRQRCKMNNGAWWTCSTCQGPRVLAIWMGWCRPHEYPEVERSQVQYNQQARGWWPPLRQGLATTGEALVEGKEGVGDTFDLYYWILGQNAICERSLEQDLESSFSFCFTRQMVFCLVVYRCLEIGHGLRFHMQLCISKWDSKSKWSTHICICCNKDAQVMWE
jgi:hypothetical protein